MRRTRSCLRTTMLHAAAAAAVFVSSACADDVPTLVSGGENEASGASTASTTSGSSATSTASTEAVDDTRGVTTSGETTAGVDTGVAFVGPELDCCGVSFECDQYAQDCPPGQKCMPWASDGGGSWQATRCSPLAEDPVEVGEPCHVQGSSTSGIDDCELGAMCWDVDSKTNEGTCIALCLGTEDTSYCADPDTTCYIASEGALSICLPTCNPLEQACLPGEGCYPSNAWTCMNDASGEQGAYGDPCKYINVCDPGLVCVDLSTMPPGLPCEGAFGCCTELCDITDPLGDQQCTGAAEGQICQPWEGYGGPAFLDDLGVCALPR